MIRTQPTSVPATPSWTSCQTRGLAALRAIWRRDRAPFLAAYVLSILCYSYLLTAPIFTNHTFPNVWQYGYPSFKTVYEGRWFADILIQLFGGSGLPAPQTLIALGIQVANGLLFCHLLRIDGRALRFLLATVIALHPSILDYYSFVIDGIAFTLGDSLILAGVLALDRIRDRRLGVAAAALAFTLSLATYQPKVALIGLLLIIWCLDAPRSPGTRGDPPAWRRIGLCAIAFAGALLLYQGSLALTLGTEAGARNHLNGVGAMLTQVVRAYPETLSNFTQEVDYLPTVLWWLPALSILVGTLGLVLGAFRRGWADVAALALALAAMPIALRLAYVINDQTWDHSGRILTAHAYGLVFFLSCLRLVPRLRLAVPTIAAIFAYFFAILAMQQTHAAVLRTIFDVEKANRILARIEAIAPDHRVPLVVIGRLRMDLARLVDRRSSLYGANTAGDTFEPYRQVELLNFLAGRDLVELPTAEAAGAATRSAAARRPWPAADSVYLAGDTMVVVLEPYVDGVTPVTMTR